MHHAIQRIVIAALVLLTFGLVGVGQAQVASVEMDINRGGGFVGLGGAIRPGTWMPLRVTLANNASELRQVRVRWLLEDADGDQVIAQRDATLNPGRQGIDVWLYGCPPMSTRQRVRWQAQVIDTKSGQLLQTMAIYPDPGRFLPVYESAIGIMSSIRLGLEDYAHAATSHEPTKLITGLSLETLPDRWYGLNVASTLIWTDGSGEGGDPNSDAFTGPMQQALRGWIRRGGHFVIVLPAVGEPWSGSPMSDLMPVGPGRMRRVRGLPPTSLGPSRGARPTEIPMTVFDVEGMEDVAVVDRDRDDQPIAVTHRFGFGAVTVLGVNLANRKLVGMGLPNGPRTVWNKVFHWQNPGMTQAQVRSEVRNSDMTRPETRSSATLGSWLASRIVMANTAAPALLAAILVFALYWLLAGPVAHGTLKVKGLTGYSWVVFVGVVIVFAATTWVGALMLQPGHTQVRHFTVLDLDGNTGQAHAQSWMSVFVPEFGSARIAIEPGNHTNHHTLASPGMQVTVESGQFPDRRTYAIPAGDPDQYDVPMRATSKQFKAEYFGDLDNDQPGMDGSWVMPKGEVEISDQFWPKGELIHHLPDALHDVLIVYCPGNNQMPWVWRRREAWAPGLPLSLNEHKGAVQLVKRPQTYRKNRQWVAEGYLGQLIGYKVGSRQARNQAKQNNQIIKATSQVNMKQELEMLSFFQALAPPNFRDTDFTGPTTTFHRRFGRRLDLSPLLSGRRLILLGHLRDSPLPMPLTVNGEAPDAQGQGSRTLVRWVYDF